MSGWDRASIEMNTRPIRMERDIRREDLMTPSNPSPPLLLAACLGCGLMLALLYLGVPLLLVSYLGVGLGRWPNWIVLASGLLFGAFLFGWEVRVRRRPVDLNALGWDE